MPGIEKDAFCQYNGVVSASTSRGELVHVSQLNFALLGQTEEGLTRNPNPSWQITFIDRSSNKAVTLWVSRSPHWSHLLMLPCVSVMRVRGVCCRFDTWPKGAISLSVILISTLFFLFISVGCCFQGWRSRKCQPLWMWTVLLCASLECTYSLLLISLPLFPTSSPLSLHLSSLHSVAEMNMHLITVIPKKSGRRDPNGTGAF